MDIIDTTENYLMKIFLEVIFMNYILICIIKNRSIIEYTSNYLSNRRCIYIITLHALPPHLRK
nr:MAG TPA: hypothetical protein [Caudoviricetes sp.]